MKMKYALLTETYLSTKMRFFAEFQNYKPKLLTIIPENLYDIVTELSDSGNENNRKTTVPTGFDHA